MAEYVPLTDVEVVDMLDLIPTAPKRAKQGTLRALAADWAYWKARAEAAETRAETAEGAEMPLRLDHDMALADVAEVEHELDKLRICHAALVEASSPIQRFLHSNITHPLCPFCCGRKKHSATCGYKIWAALLEGEDD